MRNVKANLRVIARNINQPTVITSAVLPGDTVERLFFATQVGEVFYIENGTTKPFLDISSRIIELGTNGSKYDERGLVGLAFHPEFNYNGLFYLHYSVAGSQGPGVKAYSELTKEILDTFHPNPCDARSLNLSWINRETEYDHVDTIEEWIFNVNNQVQKKRTILNIRRPFANHNGINSLNFSPENNKLVLTTGDGGSGYDPFNLSQNDLELAGKVIEIDVDNYNQLDNQVVVTRFNELPVSIQESLTVTAKGGRNLTGITFQRFDNQYIKYIGNVGQNLVESIFSYFNYLPIPVTSIVLNNHYKQRGFINFGWRGWEGNLPTTVLSRCLDDSNINEKSITFYNEVIDTSINRLSPIISYYHEDDNPNDFEGSALTAVKAYMGTRIPDLTGSIIFTDWSKKQNHQNPVRGVLAYTKFIGVGIQNSYGIIEINHDFKNQAAHFVSLGTDINQERLFLGTYASVNVKDYNKGTIYEVLPS
jgi:hypothetical protein